MTVYSVYNEEAIRTLTFNVAKIPVMTTNGFGGKSILYWAVNIAF